MTAQVDLSGMEPLLPDDRVELIAGIMRSEHGASRLDRTRFVTFIQPAREVEKDGLVRRVDAMAVFAVISPHPRVAVAGQDMMTHGTASLADFRDADRDHDHLVGSPDPAYTIFKAVVANHFATLQNLSELN